MKLFQRQRQRTKRPEPPELKPVDHSLATGAIDDAVEAHQAAQAQATEARQVVAELRKVNLRNGFTPAIEKSVLQRFQGRRMEVVYIGYLAASVCI